MGLDSYPIVFLVYFWYMVAFSSTQQFLLVKPWNSRGRSQGRTFPGPCQWHPFSGEECHLWNTSARSNGFVQGGLALVYLVYTNLEQSLSRESKQFWASPKCLVVQKMICPIGLETAMIGFGSLTRRCCNRKERSGYVSALEVFIT